MEILQLKYLKPEGAKQKNKTNGQGELLASSFRKFDSREPHADLTNQLFANRVTNFAFIIYILRNTHQKAMS